MQPDLSADKARLRQEVRQRLQALSGRDRSERSSRACSLLACQKAWQNAQTVLFYAPLELEIDVWPLLEMGVKSGKITCLPRFEKQEEGYCACAVRDLTSQIGLGRYGIREPGAGCSVVALNRLDLVLVPGVAFDIRGHRLGRGKGFYDRLLGAVRGTTCGVGFDEQIVQQVPVAPHDSDVNCILTPTRWIEL